MLKLKQRPEDFIVNEISKFDFKERGKYGIFSLQKQSLTTLEAIQRIATYLKIPPNSIRFAGNKDKHAITFQFVSIPQGSEKHNLELGNLKLTFLGYTDTPVRIGSLIGNQFALFVYSDREPTDRKHMPNYFDAQRFSNNNAEVGLSLIRKDFAKAVELIQKTDESFARASAIHLSEHPNDFVGALSLIPKSLLLLYVHSFQSLIFNRALDAYVRSKTKDFTEWEIAGYNLAFPNRSIEAIELPIPGYGTILNGAEKTIYEPLLKEYRIKPADFVLQQLRWLSQEGTHRDSIVTIKNLEITQTNYMEYQLNFVLPKGAYATIAVKSLF